MSDTTQPRDIPSNDSSAPEPDRRKLSEELEPSANLHESQADGTPNDDSSIEGEVTSGSKTGAA